MYIHTYGVCAILVCSVCMVIQRGQMNVLR